MPKKTPSTGLKHKYDIFLGGPPDRRVSEPYRKQIKEAFPELKIYDWEAVPPSDNYQATNHEALRNSLLMVTWVPDFPFAAAAEEVGYFFRHNEVWFDYWNNGLPLNREEIYFGSGPKNKLKFKQKTSPPLRRIIMIWPESCEPSYAKKTYEQLATVVSDTETAITVVKETLKFFEIWRRNVYRNDIGLGIFLAERDLKADEPPIKVRECSCLSLGECDCQNPPPEDWDGKSGNYAVSNMCPVHNSYPDPDPDCPIHGGISDPDPNPNWLNGIEEIIKE